MSAQFVFGQIDGHEAVSRERDHGSAIGAWRWDYGERPVGCWKVAARRGCQHGCKWVLARHKREGSLVTRSSDAGSVQECFESAERRCSREEFALPESSRYSARDRSIPTVQTSVARRPAYPKKVWSRAGRSVEVAAADSSLRSE
jgi:hypothetical protein